MIVVGGSRDGWIDFDANLDDSSPNWIKPDGNNLAGGIEPMLMYFTSGTTGMPKIVLHDFNHPIGHIVRVITGKGLERTGCTLPFPNQAGPNVDGVKYMVNGFVV